MSVIVNLRAMLRRLFAAVGREFARALEKGVLALGKC